MIRFDILSVFPGMFDSYFGESIIGKAQEKNSIKIRAYDLRDWTTDKHRTADDEPFGGGAGMVMKVEPIYKAVKELKARAAASGSTTAGAKSNVVLFTPRGEMLTQKKIAQLVSEAGRGSGNGSAGTEAHFILICGRYEGVDQRVHEYVVDFRFSIGNYVVSGGELPAMVFVDALARLVPGVLGSEESLKKDLNDNALPSGKIFPQYTRPATFITDEGEEWAVPEVLQSGNHAQIKAWREEHSTSMED